MTHCNMCECNFNAHRMTDDTYMAFMYHALHFCPNCAIEIFEKAKMDAIGADCMFDVIEL